MRVQDDVAYAERVYGYRFGTYARSVGWDQPDVWFAHCCMLDDGEIGQFAQASVGVAHCPSSNLRLASGIAPVRCVVWGAR